MNCVNNNFLGLPFEIKLYIFSRTSLSDLNKLGSCEKLGQESLGIQDRGQREQKKSDNVRRDRHS